MPEVDIQRKEVQWKKYKEKDFFLVGVSEHNKKIAREFLKDFEIGLNVPKGSRGKRTAGTLLKLRNICVFLNRHIKKDFEKISKKDLHKLFDDMYKGKITRKNNGKPYKDTGDFIKNTKTFWGWMIKKKIVKDDITEDLSIASYKKGKPAWVYLTHEQLKNLIDNARGDYRALLMFLYDSGVRPSEAYRIRVSDLEFKKDETLLTIPEKREDGSRVSKTFQRTIKLKTCGSILKNYIETNHLSSKDLLIIHRQEAFNKYLRQLSKKLFGVQTTKARGRTDQLKLYDIRHLSAIFWLDRYRTQKDLMFRMGWKQENKILYYSEFLGRRDKIDDEDMLTGEDKTKYEKEIEMLKKDFGEIEKFLPMIKQLNEVFEKKKQKIQVIKNNDNYSII